MSSLGPIDPDHGGRLLLRRRSESGARVDYDCELRAEGIRYAGRATVQTDDGTVELSQLEAAPDWLQQYVVACLRQAWRQHAQMGWPRRFTRWREPKPPTPNRSGASND